MKKTVAIAALLVTALGAAWAYMVSDDKRLEKLEKGADAVLDRLTSS